MASAVRTIPVSSPSAQRKYFRRSLLMWLIFIPLVFVIIIPLLFMATMAFTFEVDQFRMPIKWIPDPPTLLNFQKIFADPLIPLGRWFLNSLVVASVGTLIILFVSSLSGFAFARLQFPGKNALFSLLLFSLMIPAAITLIPSFLILRDLKLLDTYNAIWWPAAASVTGIFLLRQHFYSIPTELEDAARVDGSEHDAVAVLAVSVERNHELTLVCGREKIARVVLHTERRAVTREQECGVLVLRAVGGFVLRARHAIVVTIGPAVALALGNDVELLVREVALAVGELGGALVDAVS